MKKTLNSQFVVFDFRFSVSSGRNKIKTDWFLHPNCRLAIGFARFHQSRDAYVRCLLCKRDIKVASRGITTILEHCWWLRQHRLGCLLRLKLRLVLRRKDGVVMSKTEADGCRAQMEGVTVPDIEECPNLSVSEVFKLDYEGKPVWDDLQFDGDDNRERTIRLFVCLVIDSAYRDCHLVSVSSLWDVIVASDLQHSSLFGQGCRVRDVLVTMPFIFLCILIRGISIFKTFGAFIYVRNSIILSKSLT